MFFRMMQVVIQVVISQPRPNVRAQHLDTATRADQGPVCCLRMRCVGGSKAKQNRILKNFKGHLTEKNIPKWRSNLLFFKVDGREVLFKNI